MKVALYLAILSISFWAGQRSIIYAYDLTVLEDNILEISKQFYTVGCIEGVQHYTGTPGSMLVCLEKSLKSVQDQEDILRDKIWKH